MAKYKIEFTVNASSMDEAYDNLDCEIRAKMASEDTVASLVTLIDKVKKEKASYRVMWNDGDIDQEMYPDEEDDMYEGAEFEDYDGTDLNMVRKFAKTIKGSWIEKITIVK